MALVRLPPCQHLATSAASATPRHDWLLRVFATNDTSFDKQIKKEKSKQLCSKQWQRWQAVIPSKTSWE
jgi:hypothetical protein